MLSISNLPPKNGGGGRTPLKKRGRVLSLLSNLFPSFHLHMACRSDLAQFPCPAGHITEWYGEWADPFHRK